MEEYHGGHVDSRSLFYRTIQYNLSVFMRALFLPSRFKGNLRPRCSACESVARIPPSSYVVSEDPVSGPWFVQQEFVRWCIFPG